MIFEHGLNSEEAEKKIFAFLGKHSLLTMATLSAESKLEASTVEFFVTDRLHMFIGVHKDSRKYQNLKQNKNVALVVGGYEELTVQYEGEANEVDAEMVSEYQERFLATHLRDIKYIGIYKDLRYFRIVPKWIRYVDVRKKPWKQFEVEFNQDIF